MGQVKNNDSFLGKAEKLKPVLKHRMLRPVGVVSFERKKADSGADFWNTVGIERLGILSVMLSDEPLAYRGIVIPLLGSYWGGSQGLSSTYEQAHVDLDLLTLASLYIIFIFGILYQIYLTSSICLCLLFFRFSLSFLCFFYMEFTFLIFFEFWCRGVSLFVERFYQK